MSDTTRKTSSSNNTLIVILLAALILLGTAAGLAGWVLLSGDARSEPIKPAWIDPVAANWPYPLHVASWLPQCVDYVVDGAEVIDTPAARGGQALEIRFGSKDSADCASQADPEIRLWQAPSLPSLQGDVTTVSHERLHFARLVDRGTTENPERLTFQWQCGRQMCRLTGNVGDQLPESDLLSMAYMVVIVD